MNTFLKLAKAAVARLPAAFSACLLTAAATTAGVAQAQNASQSAPQGVQLSAPAVQIPAPIEGIEYATLVPPIKLDALTGKNAVAKYQVLEFFWYSCPHCNSFEPTLEAWHKKLPADTALVRVPVAFNDSFEPQQRLFYTLEAMGLIDKLHNKVFYAIHVEKNPLANLDSISRWVEQQGVDKKQFTEVFNSFSVTNKIKRAKQLQDAHKVDGVPSLGALGKYFTSGRLSGSMQGALRIMDYLVDQERSKDKPKAEPKKAAPAAKKA